MFVQAIPNGGHLKLDLQKVSPFQNAMDASHESFGGGPIDHEATAVIIFWAKSSSSGPMPGSSPSWKERSTLAPRRSK